MYVRLLRSGLKRLNHINLFTCLIYRVFKLIIQSTLFKYYTKLHIDSYQNEFQIKNVAKFCQKISKGN